MAWKVTDRSRFEARRRRGAQFVHLGPQLRQRVVGDVAADAVCHHHDACVAALVQREQQVDKAAADRPPGRIRLRRGVEVAGDVDEAGRQEVRVNALGAVRSTPNPMSALTEQPWEPDMRLSNMQST